ncbi:DNA ligase D [Flavitalea sp. BT771]|uniref:DNA ligase D n=1 Tax=Flavitalea sp. BT771 TaxID=3063329 RepID=UPI0026E1E87F|nr:DNA ligase D [Flavitalea sp. BT771]MDO6430546.1 DNA ligase D [Flavitalea sp. BT771]MDV6219314.1 DNA ligase D [Flavitalea sp. BT771]
MALKEYKKKRRFTATPEPQGGKPSGKALQFVVQKHAASRLHYDFRLEMEGVLKSWAIPKGPSLNPADKRLAMMVEDHPWDYKDFEGIIPEGNYGAGTVIVWDEGTYEPLAPTNGSKEAQDKELRKELHAGSLKFRMKGKKLKGEFALVRTRGRGENSWLLIKHRDKYASEEPVTEKEKSVLSKKTLEQVAANPRSLQWISNQAVSVSKKGSSPPAKKKAPAGRRSPILKNVSPMLATLVDKPFDEAGWSYEVKWDGYRAIAYLRKGEVEVRSRNNKTFNEKFYPIHQALKEWKVDAVVDGEIVVLNEKGLSNFSQLQEWRSEADGQLFYYLFDILWLDGQDLTKLPLSERRQWLASIAPKNDILRVSEYYEASGTEFFEAASKMGLEGIIAKKDESVYAPGIRTRDWLKIKTASRQEVVIGGYTLNKGSSKPFSSLLVGVFEKGKLQYTGKIGTGFSQALQKELLQRFRPLVRKTCPFAVVPDINKPSRFRPDPPEAKAVWLKPELLCEVSFREMTDDGVMRHPSFEGMREDKSAKEVGREKAEPVEKVVKRKLDTTKILAPGKDRGRRTLLNPGDASQVRSVNGHELSFSNLGKIFWPKEKYTKRDLLNYYYQAAPYILPYLKDRPQSLNRYPNGIAGKSFYQKDVTATAPGWVKQFPYHTSKGEDKNFLVVEDEASLLWMANLGAIEMNPWNSTILKPDHPDWCIIDLDPTEKNPFEQVIQTAQVTKAILDDLDVPGYCKTSGSTGIHIYIPMGAKYTYDECQLFGKLIAIRVHAELPAFTSIERMTDKRKGKIYVDYLQNRPKATLAAPYSVRPKPGATVSMPLHWEEVKKGLKMAQFTLVNAMDRIKAVGDLFKPVLGKGVNMEKILKKLNRPLPAE